jgi:hypothetical protein
MSAAFFVKGGYHAVSFLTCENNQQIVYDNNRGELIEAQWTELYKFDITTHEHPNGNYYQYYVYHSDYAKTKTKAEKLAKLQFLLNDAIEKESAAPEAKKNDYRYFQSVLRPLVDPANDELMGILMDPENICLAYNSVTFTLTVCKKHIEGRALGEEIVSHTFPNDIRDIILNSLILLSRSVGTSIHLFTNISFMYFTPLATLGGGQANEFQGEGGSKRAKRHARRTRARRAHARRKTRGRQAQKALKAKK